MLSNPPYKRTIVSSSHTHSHRRDARSTLAIFIFSRPLSQERSRATPR